MYRRTLASLDYSRGEPISHSAGRLGVTRQSVSNGIAASIEASDPQSLVADERPGRPSLWSDDMRAVLEALLVPTPDQLGYCAVNWTLPLFRDALAVDTGRRPSAATIRRELDRLGSVWKRRAPCWTRTTSARKKRRIRRKVRDLRPRSVVLAEDETDLLRCPPRRSCWSLRGQPAEVRLCGRKVRRVVFGIMNLWNGTRLFLARQYRWAEDFQAFLELIPDHYRGWHVALLWDEDPSPTAVGSLRLAGWYDIELLWLPKRCPELNPRDTLWGQGKDVISANKQYATIDDQVQRFLTYLQAFSGEAALRTAGVLSKDFETPR